MDDDEQDRGLFEDEEEDQDGENGEYGGGKELVVYLVDTAKDMFLLKGDSETYFRAVMESIEENLKSRIISNDSDQVGLCFFNTQEKKNLHEYEGVYTYYELGPVSAKLIKDVSSLKDDIKEIRSGLGVSSDSTENPLFNALSTAQSLLIRSGSAKKTVKRVLLFTNNDDPFGELRGVAKKDMVRTTTQKAQDMQETGIEIELFPMSRPGETFDIRILYANMIQVDENEDFMAVAELRLDDLKNQIRKKMFKKRTIRRLRLTVTEGAEIGLQSYAMLRTAEKGKHIKVHALDNQPLKREVNLICADTGYQFQPAEVKKSVMFGSEPVVFTPDEAKEARKVRAPQLQLLGFKPRAWLQDYYNLRPSTFLYPDEQSIKGSMVAAIALHRAMIRLNRVALAYNAVYAKHYLVALVAQEEVADEGGQVEPPGFQMIYLPWAEDIRSVEQLQKWPEGAPRATQEQIKKAEAVIARIQLTELVTPANPDLQQHYRMLQVAALDMDGEQADLQEQTDETLPDLANMGRPRVANAVREFKDAVYGEGQTGESDAALAKAANSSARLKRKADALTTAAGESGKYDWAAMAKSGGLKKLTVQELKFYLEANGLPVSGKKDLLVERIEKHLAK